MRKWTKSFLGCSIEIIFADEVDEEIELYCYNLFIEELKEQGLYKDGNIKCKICYKIDNTPIRCRYDDNDGKFCKEYCYKEIEEMVLLSKLK